MGSSGLSKGVYCGIPVAWRGGSCWFRCFAIRDLVVGDVAVGELPGNSSLIGDAEGNGGELPGTEKSTEAAFRPARYGFGFRRAGIVLA